MFNSIQFGEFKQLPHITMTTDSPPNTYKNRIAQFFPQFDGSDVWIVSREDEEGIWVTNDRNDVFTKIGAEEGRQPGINVIRKISQA
jgi:hypothetical protein